MVTMGEGLLVSRSYGQKRDYPTRPNRDLFAFSTRHFARDEIRAMLAEIGRSFILEEWG